MKRLILVVILILVMLPVYAFASPLELKSEEEYSGVALVNLQNKVSSNKNIQSSSMNQSLSVLKINDYVFDGNVITLSGDVQYKGVKKVFSLKGDAYQSGINKADTVFDVVNDSDSELSVVRLALKSSANDYDLASDKALVGQKTLLLYLFDEKARDLISFDIPAEDLGLDNVDGSNFEYSNSVTDAWIYKVVEGEYQEDNTIVPFAGVNNSKVVSISGNITYTNPYGNGCNESHSKLAKGSIVGSTIMADADRLYANLRVDYQSITYNCGPGNYQNVPNAETAIWFGAYTNPVQINFNFSGGSYVDFVKSTNWYGEDFIKRPLYSINADLSIGKGPVSVGSSVTLWENYSVEDSESAQTTVYFGGTDVTRKANFSFKNTRLYDIGSYYTTYLTIGVNKSSTSKSLTASFSVPVYGNTGSTLYSTQTNSASISYSNT